MLKNHGIFPWTSTDAHWFTDAQINRRPDIWIYGLSPVPEHMRPLSAEISNIIHESAQNILDATVEIIVHTIMDRAQRQGDRHQAHTKQNYEDTDNADYQIAERTLLSIVGHYSIKEKATHAKITSDEHSRIPTDLPTWSRDLAQDRVQTEEQKMCSRKRNRSHSTSRSRRGAGLIRAHLTVGAHNHITPDHNSGPLNSPLTNYRTNGRGFSNARMNAHPDYDDMDEDFIYEWFQNKWREWGNRELGRSRRR